MERSASPFSEDFIRRLEHLTLATRAPVSGHLRGAHRSRRTGGGMVFSDYRPYVAGDDLRNLDWGIWMRLDRLVLRLFEEEADLPVYLLVDSSASMGFGTPSKFDFARRAVAALAWLALVNHDRVTTVAWNEGVARELPVRRGRAAVWPVMRFLEELRPAGGTSLEASLRACFGARRPRSMVVLVSDFMDPAGFEGAAAWLARFGHEVFALQVLSPQELAPDLPEEALIEDAEGAGSDLVHVTPALLSAYRDALEAHGRELEDVCRRRGWTWMRAASGTAFDEVLLRALREEGVLR
jgi:uncharacterized protein (DUF58 family)